jgi:hypothetical protein
MPDIHHVFRGCESMRTVPVNQPAGPLADGCEPFLFSVRLVFPDLRDIGPPVT